MCVFLLSTEAGNSIELKDLNWPVYASFLLSEDFKTVKCWGGHHIFQFLDTVDIDHSTVFSGYQLTACIVF